MTPRLPEEDAAAVRAREREQEALEAKYGRFADAVRNREGLNLRDVPGCFLWLPLALVLTPGGCYAGAVISGQMGTVGDMAGGFETLGRMAIGGFVGFVTSVVAYRRWRKRSNEATRA